MRHLLCLTALLALVSGAGAQVVINEFQYDDSSTDDREYVELYNASSGPVDISGWVLEALDHSVPDNNPDYTIPGLPESGTTILPAGGYYVLGSALVPNVNQVVGATGLWENDVESLILRNGSGLALDIVLYEANKIGSASFLTYPAGYSEGGGIWGNLTAADTAMQSWSRRRDGLDTGNNGADFGLLPASPGASNHLPNGLPFESDFNSQPQAMPVNGWTASFFPPMVIDPVMLGPLVPPSNQNLNPNPIPPSPDGGNCMVLWDPAGGGDTASLISSAMRDMTFEAYVFLTPYSLGGTDQEQWSVGVRGSPDTFQNFFLPGGLNINNACGNSGISWHYVRSASGATLYLLDENDGGDDETVHATIPILPGVNDGWQRLYLEVAGNNVHAIFGGTWGYMADGNHYRTTTSVPGPGAVYAGYRELIAANSNARPLTMDRVSVRRPYLTRTLDVVDTNTGGRIDFDLHAGPSQAGLMYGIMVSATGGSPGPIMPPTQNNTVIPVQPDALTYLGSALANIDPLFANFVNVLGPMGDGTASSTVPVIPGFLGEIPVHFGFVTLDPSNTALSGFSSNSTSVTFKGQAAPAVALRVPVSAHVAPPGGGAAGAQAIGNIGVTIHPNGEIRATFELSDVAVPGFPNGFGFLRDWYQFRWINMVTGYTVNGVQQTNGAGQPVAPVLGRLPAMDPQPLGFGNGDDNLPWYYTDAEWAAGNFGGVPINRNSGVAGAPTSRFVDRRQNHPAGTVITFKTFLTVRSITDPGIAPHEIVVLGGFEWTHTAGAAGNVAAVAGALAPDPALINAALGLAGGGAGFPPPVAGGPGWNALPSGAPPAGRTLSACP